MLNPKTKTILAAVLLIELTFGSLSLPATASAATSATKKVAPIIVSKTVVKKKTVSTKVPRKLDGVLVSKKNANNRILAVMIENHPAARPQAGLQQASVVYETLAEGGIPRFMALFSHYGDIGLIGPIRSARPYYVRWAAEYGAAMVHAGGSPDAQAVLKSLGLRNIEALKDPTAKYFFRLGSGVHSVYTNGQKLETANNQYKKLTPVYRSWKYVSDPKLSKRRTGKHGVTVNLGPSLTYQVGYQYERASNVYWRFTGARPQVEKISRKQVAVKNVILQFVPKERVLDYKGRLELKTLGKGKGILLKDGTAITINWVKKSTRSRTIYTTGDGKEILLNRGNTWITVVPKGRSYRVY